MYKHAISRYKFKNVDNKAKRTSVNNEDYFIFEWQRGIYDCARKIFLYL